MKDLTSTVLIVVDTLRKDTLQKNLANLPNLSYLIGRSTNFRNAMSPASWTVPSHASMLTGMYPTEHKMVYHYDDELFFRSISTFPERCIPLQEALHDVGYATIALTANPLVGIGTAFEEGFDIVKTIGPFRVIENFGNSMDEIAGIQKHGMLRTGVKTGLTNLEFIRKYGLAKSLKLMWLFSQQKKQLRLMHFPTEKGAMELIKELASQDPREPYFAFANLMEMHEPYNSVEELGPVASDFMKGVLQKGESPVRRYQGQFIDLQRELSANVRIVDEFVGRLIKMLKSRGTLEETAIVLTSDHGQSLGEDNFVGHTYLLNDAIVKVPLIIKTPENKGTAEDRTVSTQGVYDFLKLALMENSWTYPRDDYIFAEAFGQHKSGWRHYIGDLSDEHLPEIRKRIWDRNGTSLTVNGSKGDIEEFSRNGKVLDKNAHKRLVNEMIDELELFAGSSDFEMPPKC